ncbi:MAG TPA: chemotaxis protein CheB, partial [Gammaproteobacteria bacterium]
MRAKSDTSGAKPAATTPGEEAATASGNAHRKPAVQQPRPSDVPLVVIGASAGGLDAMKKFLTALPVDAGIGFVLVPHLDPRQKSLMVELLA